MSNDHSDTVPESTYPPLTAPQFQSQIPDYLLKDATDQDKHIMAQLSVLTQISEWSIKAHISTMESVRKTNGRLIRAEENIQDLKGESDTVKVGWKVIAKIAAVVVGTITLAMTVYQALHGG